MDETRGTRVRFVEGFDYMPYALINAGETGTVQGPGFFPDSIMVLLDTQHSGLDEHDNIVLVAWEDSVGLLFTEPLPSLVWLSRIAAGLTLLGTIEIAAAASHPLELMELSGDLSDTTAALVHLCFCWWL